jgi:hypothetical protein
MLNLLFPSLPYSRTIDPMWQEEAVVAHRLGFTVCLYDADQQKLYPPPNTARPTLYRGWMLTEVEYQQLAALTPLLVAPALYMASHQASAWYSTIAPFTPHSVFAPANEAQWIVEDFLRSNGRCFVKGLVKSFGAESVITSQAGLATLLRKHRIAAEEPLFIREFIDLSSQAEERYFAVQGVAYGANGYTFPADLYPALAQLQSRWLCTLDVAYTKGGRPIIIEVGDGQVSDTKEWQVAELYQTVIQPLATLASSQPGCC